MKSLLLKYVAAIISCIFFFMAIFAVALNYVVSSYSENRRLQALSDAANATARYLLDTSAGGLPEGEAIPGEAFLDGREDEVRAALSLCFSSLSDTVMTLFASDGGVLLVAYENDVEESDPYAPERIRFSDGTEDDLPAYATVKALPGEALETLSSGEAISETDDLFGTLPIEAPHHVTPIYASDGTLLGAVLCYTTDKAPDVLVNTMFRTMITVLMWILLVVFVAIFILCDRITSPLKQMTVAAKQFATGKYDTRIDVRGKDEVAELASAFNQMAESLSGLEQMRSSFLASISHELRTPMTSIAIFIDSILDGKVSGDEAKKSLVLVADEIRRLSRLVSQMLDISRLEAGERELKFVPVNVCETARRVVFSFENPIEDKGLEVVFDCDEEDMFAYADEDAIHQVIYNICHNAIKFSKPGGLYKIGVHRLDGCVEVSVYNEGDGIPEEDLPYVFDRFYKGDRSRGKDKSGVGLGMYLAHAIVTAHGQTIRVESTPGKDCCFRFTLAVAERPVPPGKEGKKA